MEIYEERINSNVIFKRFILLEYVKKHNTEVCGKLTNLTCHELVRLPAEVSLLFPILTFLVMCNVISYINCMIEIRLEKQTMSNFKSCKTYHTIV